MNVQILEQLVGRIATLKARLDHLERLEHGPGAWIDYSGTSTIVGWSSSTVDLRYTVNGKIVFVQVGILGTSNSTSVSFTLPYANKAGGINPTSIIRVRDDSVYGIGVLYLVAGSATAVVYNGLTTADIWTVSGNKQINGGFFYERE